jgi:tetratricopeptide (TPR) repeat protein
MRDTELILKLDSESPERWNLKGNIEVLFGDYREAINSYNEAVKLKPNYAEAYYNRGLAYKMSNQIYLGCIDFEQSIDLGYKPAQQAYENICQN